MERRIENVVDDDGRCSCVVSDMQRSEYDAIQRMNASSLKAGLIGSFDVDPVLIREAFEQTREEPTATMQDSYDRGTLTHLILLEPEKVVDRVAVWKGDRRAGGEWKEFNEQNAGKLIMRERDVHEVQKACRAVRSVRAVNDLLMRRHATELSVFGKKSKTFLRGMIDCVTSDEGPVTLIDLKTTSRGIDEDSVFRTIRKLKYREQLALYADLYEQATGRHVEAVYLLFVALDVIGVRLAKLTTSALQFGLARMVSAIEAVEKCIEDGEWPVFYGESIMDCSSWEVDDLEIEGV